MDGMRRYFRSGSSSPLRRASVRAESRSEVSSKTSKIESRPDKTSTEYVATALLNPVVPPEEKQEYKEYVDQCAEMLDAPPDYTERKDQKVYENAIAMSTSGDDDFWLPPEKDLDTLYAFVEKASPLVSETIGSKDNLPITFNYEKWTSGCA